MARSRWHWQTEANSVTLARHWPPRMDVRGCAHIAMPAHTAVSLRRLAQQIRQDLWRKLQTLRGFSPVVTLTQDDAGLEICAGGRAALPVPAQTEAHIVALLSDPVFNERWIHWAKKSKRS